MARGKGQEVIPSAKRLIRSLRDMGYDFATAVADLVDNSIEAGATKITIDVEFNGDDSWVRIADNGIGMGLEQLQEAMRYGSEREYDGEKDLGKFGLGLKTASMSQCQRMIVASRGNKQQKEIHAYSWDMDHVDATNRWEILKVDKRELKFVLNGYLDDTTGTVVFWQRLDRILGYKHPYGENAKKRLNGMCREVEQHLAMVFHRFLAGEVPGKKFQIILNGNLVQPWDPFARNEQNTKKMDPIHLHLEYEGRGGLVTLEPFVLPHQDQFSSRDAFNHTSGPNKWNRQQGFYIYRANRLIQSGGWSGLRTIDEHTKLARIAISFSPHLDEAFKINVAKMRVQLPAQLRDQIETETAPVVRIARHTYDNANKKPVASPPHSSPQPAPGQNLTPPGTPSPAPPPASPFPTRPASSPVPGISNPPSAGAPSTPARFWTFDELQTRLESLAEPDEKPVLLKLLEKLRKTIG